MTRPDCRGFADRALVRWPVRCKTARQTLACRYRSRSVSEPAHERNQTGEKEARRAGRRTIAAYHEQQLSLLLERVREGFARLDAGEIDVFELDDLIHRYKRSARELWKFCGQTGSQWLTAARTIEFLREQGAELPDWWAAGEPRRRG